MEILIVLQIIGTIAFAVSGAVLGIEKKMDMFVVAILGLTTAVGGGILRDLVLNITPPSAFRDSIYAIIAIIISTLFFIPRVHRAFEQKGKIYDLLFLIMDSIGLGLFTVIGVQVALATIMEKNYFLVMFVGVLTGVGGGLLRDVFAGNTPYIFVKHFYACASIIGAFICIFLWTWTGEFIAMIVGASATVLLRLLAAHFRWSLPKAE